MAVFNWRKLLQLSVIIFIAAIALPIDPANAQSPSGFWRFEDGSGLIAADSSGNGNNASITGAMWTTGKTGGGLNFNGSGAHLQVPNSASITFPNQVTFALWVNASNLNADWITLMHRTNSAYTWFDWQFYAKARDAFSGANHAVFRVNWNGDTRLTSDEEVSSNMVLSVNTWYFIAVTYDGSNMRFYLNGELRGTTAKSGGIIPNGGRDIWIGGNDKWQEYFTGKLDEVRIYNTALNQSQIQALMGPVTYTLNVNINGNGSVIKNPDKVSYNSGEIVQLTAVPGSGYTFNNWAGNLTGSANPASIIMNSNRSVTANFSISGGTSYFEDFNTFTVGQTVGAHADWLDDGGGPTINAANGLLGSRGLAPAANMFTWTAHPFDWNSSDFAAAIFQMDFKSNASGQFDDDRLGWIITDANVTNSADVFGVQLDHPDGGIVTFWRNSGGTRIQEPIVPLPNLTPNTWFRFWTKITKISPTSAKIDVNLVQLDASGNPTGIPYTGSVDNSSTFPGGIPDIKYFTATTIWPLYKNFNAMVGDADNAYFELVSTTPPSEKYAFVVMSDLHTSSNQANVQSNLQHVKHLVDNATSDMPAPEFLVVTGDFPNLTQTEASIDLVLGTNYLWYPVIGNHEIDDGIINFNSIRDSKVPTLPNIFNYGPPGSVNTNYSFNYDNSHFVSLNAYWDGTTGVNADHGADGNITPALRTWIDNDITSAGKNHNFVFVHEPAFPDNRHTGDALDQYPANRDAFVQMLDSKNVEALFVGHTHYYEHDVSSEYPLLGNVHQINTSRAGDYPTGNGPCIIYVIVDGNTVTYRAYQSTSTLPFTLAESWAITSGSPSQYVLTTNIAGNGNVTKNPDKALYNSGESVQLTAVPQSGYIFSGWSGAVTGTTNPINVIMTGNLVVTATFIQEQTGYSFTETFNTGFTSGINVGEHAGWFDGADASGSNVGSGIGLLGTVGIAPGQYGATWTAHPFTWQNPDLLAVIVGADFETDASGHFDDDRVGWTIRNDDNNSNYNFAVQLDPGGTGYNIECYWDGTTDNGGRTSIVSLPALTANTFYRLQAKFTKLTNTSAKIEVFLYNITGTGNTGSLVVSGIIENTDLLPNTTDNQTPLPQYFTAPLMWPFYKNYQAIPGDADNFYFEIIRSSPVTQFTLTTNTSGSGNIAKNPNKALYDSSEVVQLTAVPASGYVFSEWTGDYAGTTNPCNITMNSNKSITAAFVPQPVTGWKAYNDLVFNPSRLNTATDPNGTQVHYRGTNITTYGIGSGYTGPTSGLLVKQSDSSSTGVTVTITQSGNVVWQSEVGSPWNGGYDPAPGTDAWNTFHGIADMAGVVYYGSTGWYVDVTFTGLNPAKQYTFVTSAARCSTAYSTRLTTYTLNGADTYTNASSTGVEVLAQNQVRFCTGNNYTLGYVAKWTGITAADGSFSIRAQSGGSVNQAYSFDVFMLEEQAPSVQQYSITVNTSGTGSVTRNPDKSMYDENEIVELTAVAAPGWVFSGWSGDLTGSVNPSSVTMTKDFNLTATFTEQSLTDWTADLTLTNGTDTNVISFGKNQSATDGIDASLDEKELPPMTPTENLEGRFNIPVIPVVSSLKDIRNSLDEYVEWEIQFQVGTSGYPVSLSWGTLPSGSFFLRDVLTGSIVDVNMKNVSSYNLTNSAINMLKIVHYVTAPTQVCMNVNVLGSWNIVSVPFRADNMTTTALLPTAAGSAFGYDNGYYTASTLETGKGYWLKFSSTQSVNLCGAEVNHPISINEGWNLIGAFNESIALGQIVTIPAGIISSDYFGYNNGYVAATTLEPGHGYWVKADQPGTIQFTGSITKTAMSEERISKSWSKIIVTDSRNRSKVMYAADEMIDGKLFELPPTPPDGELDIRYSSNRYVELLGENSIDMSISSAVYPITIRAEGMQLQLKDKLTGKMLNKILSDGETVVIENSNLKTIAISKVALPSAYMLSQNYPNPFNPTTTISFGIPEEKLVKISIYNILGEKILEILNEVLTAGYHDIDFNAANLPSGIYFFRMDAGSFTATKKMSLIK